MTSPRSSQLWIQTPEGIVFAQELAGPVRRGLAWMVDAAAVSVMSMALGTALGLLRFISPDGARALVVLAYFVLSIGYPIATEWLWRGQTVGKRLLCLRVVDVHGLRLRFSQVVIRNLLRAVDGLPLFYVVGGLAMLFSRRAQRLGDFAANTIVVAQPALFAPDLDQLMAGKFNSFREHRQLAARLRQRVSPEQARLALQALLRRDEFDPAARVPLFAELAAAFREIAAFPPEATDGLSDEQYVRNVADVLFRVRESPATGHGQAVATQSR